MIQGSMVALVTPMHGDNSLDWDGLAHLLDWHLEQGTHAIVAVGTTGESATLNVDEHLAVIKFVVKRVAGRIPVIAGTGANSTSEAIELTRGAKEAGADACLLVAPYYNKPTQQGMYLHHKAIAEAVDIPQILYNVPGRTAVDLQPETVLELAKIPNIIGIKEATGDMDRAKAIIDHAPEGFKIISGDDETAVELMILGGHGDISVTANVIPGKLAQMCELAIAGNAEAARLINAELMPLHKALFLEANPIPVKWALVEMGVCKNGIRLPLTPLSEQYHEQVRAALHNADLI
ncbi:4-hydroxy-tetrahydrodipicolinate synthase [Gilvimarinus agarilyticus]|uniref:4-hydroxy-tetrahydrodipicolinate synthase n=1 Tax=unclassified Gilvimarinus TaxID=2642066 RepID=UPI001C088815|nr:MULTISPECIES: 4-hydroxy-tetrahydrodipicolinate synthase [unclassified Gilvimarinus]MBU2885020.1 4-hydroxy-tetrahydrodipicolinate synthase [Gilvimarinus agarilyticus]MDO6569917.1 4-hydroxy-tetrahydrodipicolinate synthase [Gilvimarinus sp. 2_MG-2023]MDO6747126.1 4-hydroxy-tetrahydrodipicolinate synthase [Gilvimarinus sp. 1_MG-2023]